MVVHKKNCGQILEKLKKQNFLHQNDIVKLNSFDFKVAALKNNVILDTKELPGHTES